MPRLSEIARGMAAPALALVAATIFAHSTAAQGTDAARRANAAAARTEEALRTQLNENTISIVSGTPTGTYLALAYDLAVALSDDDNLRIFPVVGMGGLSNVRDVFLLRGMDLGIASSLTLQHFKKTGELGANIDQKLAYVTKLFEEEMHFIVGPDINSIGDLAGKKVNFSDAGSGSQLATRAVFELLGVKAEEVNMSQTDAYVKIRSGEIAGTVAFAAKPIATIARLPKEGGLRLLPVNYSSQLESDFLPATLTANDYPNLIEPNQKIDALAVSAVLFVNNWPKTNERYRRVAKFVDALFSKFPELHKAPRHPKWRDVNLAATLPGWPRFAAAQEWIDRNAALRAAELKTEFERFVAERTSAQGSAARLSEADRAKLFQQFLEWSRSRTKQ